MTAISVDVKSSQDTFATNTKGRTLMDPYKAFGNVRALYFYYKNTTGGTLAANTVIDFGPVLRAHQYLPVALMNTTALGTSRVLNLGVQEHTNRDGGTVAGDIDAIIAALDVSAAIVNVFKPAPTATSPMVVDGDAVHLLGQVTGGTIPNNGIISGFLFAMSPF